jgi:hypothetical protein
MSNPVLVNLLVGIKHQVDVTSKMICKSYIQSFAKLTFLYWLPVYLPLPGEMQNILNRFVPLIEPILRFKDNRTRAKFHKEVNIRKIVLVSVCGWWELGNFETILRIVEEVAKDVDCEFTGAVLRPHAYLMKRNSEKTKEVNDALKQCGFELGKNGILKDNLLRLISQPLISEKEYTTALTKEFLEIKTE